MKNSKYIFASKYNTRRFPNEAACYLEDAPPAPLEAELLAKIQAKVEAVIETRGLANGAAVKDAMDLALKGLSLEALRSYSIDKTDFEGQIRNLSASITQLKAQKSPADSVREKIQPLKDLLDKNWDKIEILMRNKGEKASMVLNARAAVTMTKPDAITEPAAMPNDIIESFSVDAFVKKRRPVEYIWEIVSRRTVAAITEYKTWLEEGTEDGSFAIIAEGAVKPLLSKKLVRNFSKYRKIAGKRVYTEEFAKFRKEAMQIIEDLFTDKLMRDYNAVLVTSLNLVAATYVGTALDGQYTVPTDYHAIGAVAAQEESLDFMPDLLILNPQDKWRIGLSQMTGGAFFSSIPVYNPSGVVTMMGFRVFTSNKMPVGQAILGESGLYKVEDEPIQLRLGYGIDVVKDINGFVTDVSSDVDNNRFRIIAETFFHNYIGSNNLGSFVKFTFATVKESLRKITV